MALAASPELARLIAIGGMFIVGFALAAVGGALLVIMIRGTDRLFVEHPVQAGAYSVMLAAGVMLIIASFVY